MRAAVSLLVQADDVDDANLGHRIGDHRHLRTDQVFVHHCGRAGQEPDFDRSICGELGVHQIFDAWPEALGQRVELEVHSSRQRLHVAAGDRHSPLVPDHSAQHVQRTVGTHQPMPAHPLDLTMHHLADGEPVGRRCRGIERMPHQVALLADVDHRHAVERSGVVRLPAAGRVERRAIERNSALAQRDDGRLELGQVGIT